MRRFEVVDRMRRAAQMFRDGLREADTRVAFVTESGSPSFVGRLSVATPNPVPSTGLPALGWRTPISIHPGGITLTELSGRKRAILASEVGSVEVVGRSVLTRIVIRHRAPHVGDPLWIRTGRDCQTTRQIADLVARFSIGGGSGIVMKGQPPNSRSESS